MWIKCGDEQIIKSEAIISFGVDSSLSIYAILKNGRSARIRARQENETGDEIRKMMSEFVKKLGTGAVVTFDSL